MLVREFIEWLQETLQDNKPAFARWPERGLIRWINFGQMALAKYLPQVSARVDVIKMAPGAQQSLINVAAPDIKTGVAAEGIALMRVMSNMNSNGTAQGKAVRGAVDRYSKDSLEPDWLTEVGGAVIEIVVDKGLPTRFWISPGAPASTPLWLKLEWMAFLPKLADGGAPGAEVYTLAGTGNAVALGITDQYAEELHHYVVAMSLLKGSKDFANAPKAQYHAGLFLQSINAQAQAQTGVSPNLKALPFVNEAV